MVEGSRQSHGVLSCDAAAAEAQHFQDHASGGLLKQLLKPWSSHDSAGPWSEGGGLDEYHPPLPPPPAPCAFRNHNSLAVPISSPPSAASGFPVDAASLSSLPAPPAISEPHAGQLLQHELQQQQQQQQHTTHSHPKAKPFSLYPVMSLNPIRDRWGGGGGACSGYLIVFEIGPFVLPFFYF
jgi:hypothetical protein